MTIWGNPFSTNVTRPDYAETNEALSAFIKNKPDAAIQKAQTTADNAQTAADNAKTAADNARTAADAARTLAQGKVTKLTLEGVLAASGWENLAQTLSMEGITPESTLLAAPAPASLEGWAQWGVWCTQQGAGNLTFRCRDVPKEDLTVNVLILN